MKELINGQIPAEFALKGNYPNPFNPVTTIIYDLPEKSFVLVTIYDISGREITTLVNGIEIPGFKRVLWDGRDAFGNPVSSGMYLYHISAKCIECDEQFSQTRKMVLLR